MVLTQEQKEAFSKLTDSSVKYVQALEEVAARAADLEGRDLPWTNEGRAIVPALLTAFSALVETDCIDRITAEQFQDAVVYARDQYAKALEAV